MPQKDPHLDYKATTGVIGELADIETDLPLLESKVARCKIDSYNVSDSTYSYI